MNSDQAALLRIRDSIILVVSSREHEINWFTGRLAAFVEGRTDLIIRWPPYGVFDDRYELFQLADAISAAPKTKTPCQS